MNIEQKAFFVKFAILKYKRWYVCLSVCVFVPLIAINGSPLRFFQIQGVLYVFSPPII